MNLKETSTNQTLDIDMLHFLPHYESEKDYRLLYAPYNVFMFFKFFFAVYERIVMT